MKIQNVTNNTEHSQEITIPLMIRGSENANITLLPGEFIYIKEMSNNMIMRIFLQKGFIEMTHDEKPEEAEFHVVYNKVPTGFSMTDEERRSLLLNITNEQVTSMIEEVITPQISEINIENIITFQAYLESIPPQIIDITTNEFEKEEQILEQIDINSQETKDSSIKELEEISNLNIISEEEMKASDLIETISIDNIEEVTKEVIEENTESVIEMPKAVNKGGRPKGSPNKPKSKTRRKKKPPLKK